MKKMLLTLLFICLIITTGCGKNQDHEKITKVTFGKLKFNLSSVFELDKEYSDNDSLFYNYNSEDNKNGCMLHLFKSPYISDDLKQTVKEGLLNQENFEYKTIDINNNTWAIGFIDKGVKQKKHYYAINFDNTLYQIGYDDLGSGDLCEKYIKDIEKSLKF